ncbi:MAG: aldo/keto reductase [Synergistaceae bacterium]|jgi:aryl-alcohol dehydrogenase-like predicted oxidoreductase|nr:aldo/keto reductase [Synergistaceae bacterium]
MRYKDFGKTGLKTSVISVGTWGIGGDGWGGADRDSSIGAIRAMIDNGVNLIDTAPAYGFGEAEKVVGRAIKGYDRSKLVISTKVGLTWPNGELFKNASRANIMREIDVSLKNLDTDYIDLYIVHWPDIDTKAPASETFEALSELKSKGKIRFIGVSNHSIEQMEEGMKHAAIDAIQPQHSMVCSRNEKIMKWAHDHGAANMAYGPLGAGILTGHYREIPKFEPDDWRILFYPFFKEPFFSKTMDLLKTLDAIAADHKCPVSHVTINWSAQHPLVDTALLGVRSAKHAEENCAAMEWSLSGDEISRINKAIDETVGK